VLLSGRAPDKLWEVEDLQPYQAKPGLTFVLQRGRIRPLRTVRNLNLVAFYRDIRNVDASGVDLVISDFEPLSVRIAARRGLVSIGLGHQYAFRYPVPKPRGRWINRLVLARYAPVKIALGLHWHHFNAPILPPIIPELPVAQPVPRKAVVYLPFEDPDDVLAAIEPLGDWEFFIYQDVPAPRDRGHCRVRPFSRSGFRHDLATAEAVIANAGFELTSEALHLGKKLVVRPLGGQMEQEANALACEELGLAAVIRRLDAEVVRKGLKRPPGPPRPVPDWVGELTAWIGRAAWRDVEPLVASAWSQAPRIARTALEL
jgi:uncharacterized protein (TIGR00661 family)